MNRNSQKSNRSGARNQETTIQIEDDLADDMNKIVINNVITFNEDEASISSSSEKSGG